MLLAPMSSSRRGPSLTLHDLVDLCDGRLLLPHLFLVMGYNLGLVRLEIGVFFAMGEVKFIVLSLSASLLMTPPSCPIHDFGDSVSAPLYARLVQYPAIPRL